VFAYGGVNHVLLTLFVFVYGGVQHVFTIWITWRDKINQCLLKYA
jgi:hypothetical protein